MTRPVYVYRLHIEYPGGVDWRNPPKDWEPLQVGPDEQTLFRWPARRHYISRKAARDRADLLRRWGCVVTIECSKPVEWST